MTLTKMLIPTAIIAALSLATAAPAGAAERHGGGGHGGSGSHSSRVSRGGSVSRGSSVSRDSAVSRGGARDSAISRGGVQPQMYSAVPRGKVLVAPRIIGSRGVVVGPYFSRPYYSFRPRFSIGFGLWAGYPVPYPSYYYYSEGYGYDDPYGYGYSYPSGPYANGYPPSSYNYPPGNQPYGYPPSGYPSSSYPPSGYPTGSAAPDDYPPQPPAAGSIGVQPGGQQPASGGISFEITPSTAAVFVDGVYVGSVAMFDPTSQPLGLIPGRHHIEIRAAGYQTMAFDADVTAGRVIPYQGTSQVAPR